MIASNYEHRSRARGALRGNWQAVLIVMLMLFLIGGKILHANVTYTSRSDGLYDNKLVVQAGPIRSETYYVNGRIETDAGRLSNEPGLVPLSNRIVMAALGLSFALFLLQPVYSMGCARLGLRVLQGEEADFGVLRISFKTYLRAWNVAVRTALGTMLVPLPLGVAGALVFALLPADFALRLAVLIACLTGMAALMIMRGFGYAAVYTLLALRPETKAREITRESKQLMRGHRGQLFALMLSFAGWGVLGALGAGALGGLCGLLPVSFVTLTLMELVPVLPLLPLDAYIHTAHAAFVLNLVENAEGAQK